MQWQGDLNTPRALPGASDRMNGLLAQFADMKDHYQQLMGEEAEIFNRRNAAENADTEAGAEALLKGKPQPDGIHLAKWSEDYALAQRKTRAAKRAVEMVYTALHGCLVEETPEWRSRLTDELSSRREQLNVILDQLGETYATADILIATLDFLEDRGGYWHLRPGVLDNRLAKDTIQQIRTEINERFSED